MTRTFFPPGPRSRLPGDQYFAFRRDPLRLLMRVARDYGDLAHFQIGSQRVFLLNHPDLIRDVLVTHHENFTKGPSLQRAKKSLLGEGLLTSEGERHQRQRRLIQPAFHRAQMARYGAVMLEYAGRMSERWEDGQTLDIAEEMRRLTLAIVAKTLFGADVEAGAAGEVVRGLARAMRRLELSARPPTPAVVIGMLKKKLAGRRRSPGVRELLDATIQRIIAERRQSDRDHGDLLSMLLHAQDEESGDRMTDQQLRDEVVTIFIAGHETTANALAWAWYLLSQHPEVEAKLHRELDEVLAGKPDAVIDPAQLPYANMVFTETLRLYSPSWILGRIAINDYRINDYVVPAGALILMSQYVMHRDARYYPDPFRFDPERWRPEAREARPLFSYFPFGGGTRRCIGDGFAWVEWVLLMATLAKEWRMRLVSSSPIEPQPLITLRPGREVMVRLERRKTKVGPAASPSDVGQSKSGPAN
ncbi:MAG: cytochrome P450 [Acidobacteriota bacterium]|nr:cytochrome P450 [Acidobacteriota bacterium]